MVVVVGASVVVVSIRGSSELLINLKNQVV